ncbi:MAG: glycine cleavage system protein GcvH [Thermoplasmata archaeon]|nr:glycine cleavage system protein GcvH [Thermoplasmata archaeon]
MSGDSVPTDRQYTRTHEWVKEDGGMVRMGITDHAQSELTDIVFVDLPQVGKKVEAGAVLLSLESVKTVADVYAPATGTVSAVNEALKKHPELLNKDPYGEGWIVEVTPEPGGKRTETIDAAGYRGVAGIA